jgi:hypothetical protein
MPRIKGHGIAGYGKAGKTSYIRAICQHQIWKDHENTKTHQNYNIFLHVLLLPSGQPFTRKAATSYFFALLLIAILNSRLIQSVPIRCLSFLNLILNKHLYIATKKGKDAKGFLNPCENYFYEDYLFAIHLFQKLRNRIFQGGSNGPKFSVAPVSKS